MTSGEKHCYFCFSDVLLGVFSPTGAMFFVCLFVCFFDREGTDMSSANSSTTPSAAHTKTIKGINIPTGKREYVFLILSGEQSL